MSDSKYKVKKKRRFKKGFLFFIFSILILLLCFVSFLILKKNSNFDNLKAFFIEKTTQKEKEVTFEANEEEDIVEMFILRLPSQNLDFASSSLESENGDLKIFLKKTKEDAGYIYVNKKDNPEFVWITFASAISQETLKAKLENDLENLEYIDLRFGNKVFYKFRDGSVDIATEPIKKNSNTATTSSSSSNN